MDWKLGGLILLLAPGGGLSAQAISAQDEEVGQSVLVAATRPFYSCVKDRAKEMALVDASPSEIAVTAEISCRHLVDVADRLIETSAQVDRPGLNRYIRQVWPKIREDTRAFGRELAIAVVVNERAKE